MDKFKSRKFWAAMITGVLIVLNDGLGWNVPAETVTQFAAVVLGWVFAEAYVDGKYGGF